MWFAWVHGRRWRGNFHPLTLGKHGQADKIPSQMKPLFPRIAQAAILPFLVWSAAKIQGQVFQPGNLVLLRLGDNTQTLVNSGNTIYLDGYNRSGALLTSVRLPDNGSTSLILSGTAGTEGGLTRSLDGRLLAVMGYNTNRGSTLAGSLSSQ